MSERFCEQLLVADDLDEANDIIRTAMPTLIVTDSIFFSDQNPSSELENNKTDVVFIKDISSNNIEYAIEKIENCTILDQENNYEEFSRICQEIKNQSSDKSGGFEEEFFVDSFAASIPIAGKSSSTQYTLKMLKRVAESNCNPVLVVGETGTGKELAARAIHKARHAGKKF